jgi:hypothetical protein
MPLIPAEDLRRQIERLTERVSSARIVARAIIEGQEAKRRLGMTDKLPNLGGIAGALDKLTSAIESDAQKFLQKIEGVHAKRARVFAKADDTLTARNAALDETEAALDKLNAALGDNGGPSLSGGSSN